MDTPQLRRWLAKKLGQPVEGWVWEALTAYGWLHDVELGGDPSSVLATAKEIIRAAEGGKSPTRRRRRALTPTPATSLERARTKALSEYLAYEAELRHEVRDLRQNVLEGRLLSPEQAVTFLSSPANRMFSLDILQAGGGSPVRHEAEIVHEEHTAQTYRADVRITPDGRVWPMYNWVSPDNAFLRRDGRPVGTGLVHTLTAPTLAPPLAEETVRELLEASEEGLFGGASGIFSATYWIGSILADVHGIAKDLTRWYPWSEPEAMGFLLTGRAPLLPAIAPSAQLLHGLPSSISLTVRPWVSPMRVAEVYRSWQRHYFSGRPGRPLSERNLSVFWFATRRLRRSQRTWRQLMDEWNGKFPYTKYSDVRLFRRDYERAGRILRSERFGFGWEQFPTRETVAKVAKVARLLDQKQTARAPSEEPKSRRPRRPASRRTKGGGPGR